MSDFFANLAMEERAQYIFTEKSLWQKVGPMAETEGEADILY